MKLQTQSRIIKWAYSILGIIPVTWLTLLAITYFKVAAVIGHLPTYDDQLSTQFIMFMPYSSTLNMCLMAGSMIGVIIVPLLTIGHFIFSKFNSDIVKPTWINLIVGNMGYFLFLICWNFSPMNTMVCWYVD